MSTRAGREFCDPCGKDTERATAPYLSMLVNNIEVEGKATENTPPQYIIYVLASQGNIAYIPETNDWAEFVSADRNNRFYLPRRVRLKGDSGEYSDAIAVDPLPLSQSYGIKIIPANVERYAPQKRIRDLLKELDEVKINIRQNLRELRSLAAVVVSDDTLDKELTEANTKREQGATSVVLHKRNATTELEVINFSPNAVSHLTEYLEREEKIYERIDNTIGVTRLADRQERAITSEVEVSRDNSAAIIDMLINSINKYGKYYGIDIHAKRLHDGAGDPAAEEIPKDDSDGVQNAQNKAEGGNNE